MKLLSCMSGVADGAGNWAESGSIIRGEQWFVIEWEFMTTTGNTYKRSFSPDIEYIKPIGNLAFIMFCMHLDNFRVGDLHKHCGVDHE